MAEFYPKPKLLPEPNSVVWGEDFLSWDKAAFEISPDGFAVGDLFLGILFQFDAVAKCRADPFAKRHVRVVA